MKRYQMQTLLTITEILNLQQTGKKNAISVLKDTFTRKFPAIKRIFTTEARIKV
jgi:hypothetical protein